MRRKVNMPQLLDDITMNIHKLRSLIKAGQQDETWEMVQAYLNDHPSDVEFRLLKAELCLELERDLPFAAQLLDELQGQNDYQVQVAALLERAEKLASQKLAEGRSRLDRGYIRDSSGNFDTGCELLA